jgi:hypothetical protein
MIRIRSFHGHRPCPSLDVTTGSNRVAAQEAHARACRYGNWDDVSIDFDGCRPLRGDELSAWIRRHFPDLTGGPQ